MPFYCQHSQRPLPHCQGVLERQLTLAYFIVRLNWAGRLGKNLKSNTWSTIVRLILFPDNILKFLCDFGCLNNQCSLMKDYHQLRVAKCGRVRITIFTRGWSEIKALSVAPSHTHTPTAIYKLSAWSFLSGYGYFKIWGRKFLWVEFHLFMKAFLNGNAFWDLCLCICIQYHTFMNIFYRTCVRCWLLHTQMTNGKEGEIH